MQMLIDYPWPGNVRELKNLVDSMVVLAPGREIQPDDLPRQIRDGGSARLLPVRMPTPGGRRGRGRRRGAAGGQELEFIVRSLLELKLQVEELRHRSGRRASGMLPRRWVAGRGRRAGGGRGGGGAGRTVAGIEPRAAEPPPNEVVIPAGTSMLEVERRVIEAALRETRGNRRKAAEMLGIGERTLYRKIKEFNLPELDDLP